MKRLCFIMFALLPFVLSAQTAITATDAYEYPNPTGIDHVYIFPNLEDAEIFIPNAIDSLFIIQGLDSIRVDGVNSITNYNRLDDNTGYILYSNDSRTTFWCLDYSNYRITNSIIEVTPDYWDQCNNTQLTLTSFPEMSYGTQWGTKQTINRIGEIHYTSLAWADDDWQDSLCIEKVILREQMTVAAPLCNTEFTLVIDDIALALGLNCDSLKTDIYQTCAVAAHPTTITTIRGTETERINELERPVEETQLEGSAPLDILFKANATPAARYYKWQILKGNDLIAQRTDEQHRYVFDDSGVYRVLLWVSNDQCQTDSTEITISVTTSQLVVPNVFTPNGDGINDEFRVMYRSIIEFECWVYNRWGKLVYHWTDPAKGWDGTINGRPAAEGAYYYIIRAKGADAEANGSYHKVTKKKPADIGIYQLSGDINLIRGKK